MFVVFCLVAPIAGQAAVFRDLPKTYTFYDDVKYLTEKNIISGYPDGSFGATDSVTRQQAAIMIGRALKLNEEPRNTKFIDVNAKITGSGYIASAVDKGIITGFPDNTYRPGEPVTRAQMAIFLDRAFQLEDSNQTNRFVDVSPGMKAYQAILNVHASGIAFGYEDGKYRPELPVTRGQFAAFLARALEPSFRGTPTFTVESVSGREKGTQIINADIDTEWKITFNNRVNERTLEKNIYIVRERDQQTHTAEAYVDENDPKSVKLDLAQLFEPNETYTLHITKEIKSHLGYSLTEPIHIKFKTNQPQYNINKFVANNGLQFEMKVDQKEDKVFVNTKVTNNSNEAVPYHGTSGCDPGISAKVYSDTKDGSVAVGSQWRTKFSCTSNAPQYTLDRGKSIEVVNVLYPPKGPTENLYVKVRFNKGNTGNSYSPLDFSIPLQK
jgi:hypothetical protein